MLKYFQTTTMILFFCYSLSILWAVALYWCVSRNFKFYRWYRYFPALPSLVMGPLCIFLGMSLLGINFIYPPHFVANNTSILLHGIVPGIVLLFASGLFSGISQAMVLEYDTWSSKNFVTLAAASGLSKNKVIFKLVITKVLLESWLRYLPWVIGDLIILETIFNAPGLGLDAWHLAKSRDIFGMVNTILWLVALYFLISFGASSLNRKLGQKLEGYV